MGESDGRIPTALTQPIIANIDSDEKMEILFGIRHLNNNMIIAVNSDGTVVQGFPKQLLPSSCGWFASVPLINDIDNDGELELIAHSQNFNVCFSFDDESYIVTKMWDLSEAQNPQAVEWPKLQYDSYNTGCYKCNI